MTGPQDPPRRSRSAAREHDAGHGDHGSNRPIRLVVDAAVSAKTDMGKLGHDVSAKLEKIVGVSVYDVAYAEPEDVLIRKESSRA